MIYPPDEAICKSIKAKVLFAPLAKKKWCFFAWISRVDLLEKFLCGLLLIHTGYKSRKLSRRFACRALEPLKNVGAAPNRSCKRAFQGRDWKLDSSVCLPLAID
jgi:hypothetical protein